ncbi:MAG: YfhL family 4Fe-4S dicluster ferredoxin [Dehalococcoidia bacterium]|nr:YfhL family 4Fe-4S dicluster ferredoxin [Dehalococcoidia bacterium]
MSYQINDDCISCGACETDCPNKAIREGENIYEIDPERCSECVGSFAKPQCTEICPVGAPCLDKTNPETTDQLLSKWKQLHPDEPPKLF